MAGKVAAELAIKSMGQAQNFQPLEMSWRT
jgi:hypothetical protein